VEATGARTAAEIGPSGWREYVAATRERARRRVPHGPDWHRELLAFAGFLETQL